MKNLCLRICARVVLILTFIAFIALATVNVSETAHAEASYFSSGSGTVSDPFIISDSTELCTLSTLVNGGVKKSDGTMYSALYYKLGSSIDMDGVTFSPIGQDSQLPALETYIDVTSFVTDEQISDMWTYFCDELYYFDGTNYTSCADSSSASDFPSEDFYIFHEYKNAFYGKFDGNGKTISNLSATSGFAGLFGVAMFADIKNVYLEDSVISGVSAAGGIVGKAVSCNISNCAVLGTSVSASSSTSSAGGVAGTVLNETYGILSDSVVDYVSGTISASIDGVAAVSSFISAETAGGIAGSVGYGGLRNALSFVSVTGTLSGTIAGKFTSSESAVSLISLGNGSFGELSTSAYTSCIYPSDLFTDDKFVSAFTSADFALLPLSSLVLGTPWQRAENEGTTYYYPSPVAGVRIGFTAYRVTLDDVLIDLVNPSRNTGANITVPLPSSVLEIPVGYSFSHYSCGNNNYYGGETVTVSSDLEFNSFIDLIAPSLSDVTVHTQSSRGFSSLYNGLQQTALYVAYENPYGLVSELKWYKSTDGANFAEITSPEGGTIKLKDVAETAYYKCSVTVYADDEIPNLSSSSSFTAETSIYLCEIRPVSAIVRLSALLDESDSAVYTGSVISPTVYASTQNVLEQDEDAAISAVLPFVVGEEIIKNVGTYTLNANITLPNYTFSVVPTTFTVTPASITADVAGFSGMFDGYAHSVTVSNIVTAGDEEFTVEYYYAGMTTLSLPTFTDVCDATIGITVRADNHHPLQLTEYVAIAPFALTITADTDQTLVKTYDGNARFPVSEIPNEYFTASYTGPFSGTVITMKNAVANGLIGNVTVTVTFECGSNFSLATDTVTLNGVIEKALVSVSQLRPITAVYNGGTNYVGAIYDEDYRVDRNSPAAPPIYLISATANSADVTFAHTLTVSFGLTNGTYFRFENGTGVYEFSFALTPKELTADGSKLHAQNRDYDGTTKITLIADEGFISGAYEDIGPVTVIGSVDTPDASDEPKAVTVVSIILSSSNYTVDTDFSTNLTVLISKATPSVTASVASDAIYSSFTALPQISCSADGTISWDALILDGNGRIDLEAYGYDEEIGEIAFPYTFIPDDSDNYLSVTASYTISVTISVEVDITVNYIGQTEFSPFDTVTYSQVNVKLLFNDGISDRYITSDEFFVSYEDDRSYFQAGDTYFTVTYYGSGTIFSKTVPISVSKAVLVLNLSGTEFEYTGGPRTFIPGGYSSALMDITDNVKTDADDYVAHITLKPDAEINYMFAGESPSSVSIPWKISPAKRYKPFLEETRFTYSAEAVSVSLRNDNRASDFFTATGDFTATDVGDYYVTVTLKDNHIWADGSEAPVVLPWKIVAFEVNIPQIYDLPFTYDGYSHNINVDRNSLYAISGALTYKEAGDYEAYAELNDTDNYAWTDGTTDRITLGYRVAPIMVIKPTFTIKYVFSGNAYVIGKVSDVDYILGGEYRAANKGFYTATVSLPDQTNYVWDDGTTETYEVEWRILSLSVKIPTLAGVNGYTGKEQTALINADSAHCNLRGNVGIAANAYTATVSLKDKNNTTWADGTTADKQIDWVINPAVAEIPAAPETTFYSGMPQRCSVPLSDSYKITGGEQTEAGVHTVTVSLIDTVNYCWNDGSVSDKVYEWCICRIYLSIDNNLDTYTSYALGATLPKPYKDGYAFLGWYLKSDFSGEPITDLSSVNGDSVLYARFEKTENLNFGGGSKYGVLGEKAIIGIAVAASSLVVGIMIVVLGFVVNGGAGSKQKRRKGARPTDM